MEHVLDMESLKKLTPEQQKTLISGVKQQAAILNAQNMITVSSLALMLLEVSELPWFTFTYCFTYFDNHQVLQEDWFLFLPHFVGHEGNNKPILS